jgi:hypothetical protein
VPPTNIHVHLHVHVHEYGHEHEHEYDCEHILNENISIEYQIIPILGYSDVGVHGVHSNVNLGPSPESQTRKRQVLLDDISSDIGVRRSSTNVRFIFQCKCPIMALEEKHLFIRLSA